MAIDKSAVKQVRERTGAGVSSCFSALKEANGDIDKAIDYLRKSGQVKAAKKATAQTKEGIIVIAQNLDRTQVAILEINCETDFVATNQDFIHVANKITTFVLENKIDNIDNLLEANIKDDQTVDTMRQELVAKIGENIQLKRLHFWQTEQNRLVSYLHHNRIGVVLEIEGGNEELGKMIAMHVAAMRPLTISANEIPTAIIDKEREILSARATESGKPQAIIDKIINGQIQKFINESCLLGQVSIRDNKKTIAQVLKESEATIKRFIRLEVGEKSNQPDDNP